MEKGNEREEDKSWAGKLHVGNGGGKSVRRGSLRTR